MATEYLAKVNLELLEIESFFQELYQSSSALPSTYTPGLLPYLRLNGTPGHGSDRRMSTSSYKDQLLDDFVLEGVTTPVSSTPSLSLYSESEEVFTADLRVRYKELKAIQDQLHLELTRHQLWQERNQHEKASILPSASACQSCNNLEVQPDRINKEAEEVPPVQAPALKGRLGSLWSNLTGREPTACDTTVKSSTPNGNERCFGRRCTRTEDKTPTQSPKKDRTDDANSNASASSACATTGLSFRQASLLTKLGYLFSFLLMGILGGVILLPGPGLRHGPHNRDRHAAVMTHDPLGSMASATSHPVIDFDGPLAGNSETGKAHRCKGFMKHKHTKHHHGDYPWPRH
ncbi:hypothetical protein BG003_011510 [Podila horticola]|nr:hypothetical protein BG003_011510 [Podila horticola]